MLRKRTAAPARAFASSSRCSWRWYFPPGYRGIQAVLITEFNGHQPVTMTFNAGEKKGAATAEFSPVMPGSQTPRSKAYNARISKLNLAKRFPLNVTLKKCA